MDSKIIGIIKIILVISCGIWIYSIANWLEWQEGWFIIIIMFCILPLYVIIWWIIVLWWIFDLISTKWKEEKIKIIENNYEEHENHSRNKELDYKRVNRLLRICFKILGFIGIILPLTKVVWIYLFANILKIDKQEISISFFLCIFWIWLYVGGIFGKHWIILPLVVWLQTLIVIYLFSPV